jgi:hypothetical protein
LTAAAWVLFCAVAVAHPFGQAVYGHAIDVTVTEDHVRVDYLADVPTRELWSDLHERERMHASVDRFVQDAGLELLSGLSLTIDGQAPSKEKLPSEPPKIDERFVTFALAFQVPLPEGAHRIAVGNANAPEKVAYHLIRIDVARKWEVDATSLVDIKAGLYENNQWRMDEAGRSAWVDIAPRSAIQAAILAVHPDRHGTRLADVALATTSFEELGHTWVPLVFMVAGIVGAAILRWRFQR